MYVCGISVSVWLSLSCLCLCSFHFSLLKTLATVCARARARVCLAELRAAKVEADVLSAQIESMLLQRPVGNETQLAKGAQSLQVHISRAAVLCEAL